MLGDLLAEPPPCAQASKEHETLRRIWDLYEEQMSGKPLTQLSSGMIAVDERGRVASVNEPAVFMLGLSNAGQIVGEAIGDVFASKATQTALAQELARPRGSSKRLLYEFQRNGDEAILALDLGPRTQPYRCTILLSDITSRVLLEAELRRARDMALMHERQTNEFLANVSHELRTPMNGVIGMADLLEDTELSPQQAELVDLLKHSSEHLLCIINDILDLAKLEAGHLALESATVQLEELLQKDLIAHEVAAEEKGLALVCQIEPDVPISCHLDRLRVRQVLANLVSNAVKFTDEGWVVVRCRLAEQGTMLHFEVEDTGPGVNQRQLPQLFASFVQADAGSTRRYGGTGLGLTICSKLIQRMGGRIGAESELGRGSVFWFAIPLRNAGKSRREHLACRQRRTVGCFVPTPVLAKGLSAALASLGAEQLVLTSTDLAGERPAVDALIIEAGQVPWNVVTEATKRWSLLPNVVGLILPRQDQAARELATEKGYLSIGRMLAINELSGLIWKGDCRERSSIAVAVSQGRFEGMKVLVAEDNPVNQKLITRLLQKMGAEVLLASDGLQAVHLVASHPEIGLVFMDCQMPRMDGFEATRQIRQYQSKLPICALTANAMSSDRDRCLAAGMNDYLTKPVRGDELAHAMLQWAGSWDKRDLT